MSIFELFSADAELENDLLRLSDHFASLIDERELSDDGFIPPRIDQRLFEPAGFMPRLAA